METNPNYQRDISPELIFEGDLAHASLDLDDGSLAQHYEFMSQLGEEDAVGSPD